MSLTEPSGRRLLPVRLTQIQLAVRYQAALREARHATTVEQAQELLAAAVEPSATVYWVAPEAGPLLRSIAAPADGGQHHADQWIRRQESSRYGPHDHAEANPNTCRRGIRSPNDTKGFCDETIGLGADGWRRHGLGRSAVAAS